MSLNFRQLEAFRALMLGKTVTRAAGMLFITQPAVTRLIRDLERQVGFELFERRKGRLHPTPEALALYQEVDTAFIGLDQIARHASMIRDFSAGRLTIGGMPALSLQFLPRVIHQFLQAHPGIAITLHSRSSQKIAEQVAAQHCDLGLAALDIDVPGVQTESLWAGQMVCVLPPDHRLVARAFVTPQDLAGEVFISLGTDHRARFQIDSVFAEAEVERRLQIETPLSATAIEFVKAGTGVTITEPVSAYCQTDKTVVVKPFKPTIPFEFLVLYPAERPRSRLAHEFVQHLRQALRQLVIP
ncbi:MAG: LysR family transcriptional regulator [Candidatus Competibacteraceae bacterium]|nr:LysR family transcriptional regulator [Candidatus Competibacteraceae bacterium]MCB1804655.1 LysR family transcriptional regulator [Candidatus Competibacteraceae bacterium]